VKSNFQPWWLCIVGGLVLIFGTHDSANNFTNLLNRLGSFVNIADPAIKQLADDSAVWTKETARPDEIEAVAKCFDSAAEATGDVRPALSKLRESLDAALSHDGLLAWSDFRKSTMARMRILRDANKVDDSAQSHRPYMQAIAQGVRRGK